MQLKLEKLFLKKLLGSCQGVRDSLKTMLIVEIHMIEMLQDTRQGQRTIPQVMETEQGTVFSQIVAKQDTRRITAGSS